MKCSGKMKLCVTLFLLMIPMSLAQEDLKGKVFLFPGATFTNYVVITPNITKPLQGLSVCLQFYSRFERTNHLFSLATPDFKNAFYISESTASAVVAVNREFISFTPDPEYSAWRLICVTWDSSTGVIQLWVNGKLSPRSVVQKGSSIAAEANVMVGQDHGSFTGSEFKSQSFTGEITDVNMWDYVLSRKEIEQVLYINGNIINWRSLVYELKGEVLVQPQLQCRVYRSSYLSCK